MSIRSLQKIIIISLSVIVLWILLIITIFYWDDLSISPIQSTPDIDCLSDEQENVFLEKLFVEFNVERWWFLKHAPNQSLLKLTDEYSEKRVMRVWPNEDRGDRIIEQLMFVPQNLSRTSLNGRRLKKILLYNEILNWPDSKVRSGRFIFLYNKCPVSTCTITCSKKEMPVADAVIFKNVRVDPEIKHRPQHQVWIAFTRESPYHTTLSIKYTKLFNWTSTYRRDSDVPAIYGKFIRYDPLVKTLPLESNFAENKTKKVAWVVSNCKAKNNRMEYAKELSRYIDVDIFGLCGTKNCSHAESDKCFEKLGNDYKFYLAFENSNCRDYITEKFFDKALSHNFIPIVMGAPKKDYIRVAPYNSFIHVDDFESPRELAAYLDMLHENDTLYNEYFKWKGTGEIINDHYFCRLCAMLHDKPRTKVYDDFDRWWRRPGVCTEGSWRNPWVRKLSLNS